MKSKTLTISTLALALAAGMLVGCGPEVSGTDANPGGSSPSPTSSAKSRLMGSWISSTQRATQGNLSLEFDLVFTFEPSRMTNTVRCRMSTGQAVEVAVSSAAEITDQSIRTLESSERFQKINGLSCRVNVAAGTFRYSIEGRSLRLIGEDGEESAPLTRL